MNTTNMAIRVVNDAWRDGILTGFLVVLYLFIKQVIPKLERHHHNKLQNDADIHLAHALNATERFAGIIIPELAKMGALSNSDRRQEAIRFVSLQLLDHGFHVDQKTIKCTVEKIYQYMKSQGHLDIVKPKTMPDPSQMTTQQISMLTSSDVSGDDNHGQNH